MSDKFMEFCVCVDCAALYGDLLYQVANRFPGETRHETAKRYLRNAENSTGDAARTTKGEL